MSERLERIRVWNAAKMAINAYEEDPCETNAVLVEAAMRSVRSLKEESTGRLARDRGWIEIPRQSKK